MAKYRVIVEQVGDDKDETLFEIVGAASLVQSVVPGVLDAVLSGSDEVRPLADRVFDSAVDAERADRAAPGGPVEPPKQTRPRRTKAQIAADKEAEGLGFRDAAHRAEVEAQQAGQPTVEAPPIPAPALPEQASPAAPVTAPASVPADAAPPAQPWNPFQQ